MFARTGQNNGCPLFGSSSKESESARMVSGGASKQVYQGGHKNRSSRAEYNKSALYLDRLEEKMPAAESIKTLTRRASDHEMNPVINLDFGLY